VSQKGPVGPPLGPPAPTVRHLLVAGWDHRGHGMRTGLRPPRSPAGDPGGGA
jgi:hypothetical protein